MYTTWFYSLFEFNTSLDYCQAFLLYISKKISTTISSGFFIAIHRNEVADFVSNIG